MLNIVIGNFYSYQCLRHRALVD